MSEMKETTAICPVSFIDNKIVTDKDINGLFINPYNYKINFDQLHGTMINEIQRNYEDKNSRSFRDWRYDIQYTTERVNSLALKTYMITNISDLVRNTLIKFMEEVFFDKETLKVAEAEGFKAPNTQAECIGSMFGGCFESEINIEEEVKNALLCSNLLQMFNNDRFITAQMIYVLTDMKMSALYSILISNIFDKFIVDHVNVALTHQSLDQLYTFLYYKCFNEDPKELPNAQIEYSFCVGMMREIMDQCLINFRAALVCVSKNYSLMVDQLNKSAKENNLLLDKKRRNYDEYDDDDF